MIGPSKVFDRENFKKELAQGGTQTTQMDRKRKRLEEDKTAMQARTTWGSFKGGVKTAGKVLTSPVWGPLSALSKAGSAINESRKPYNHYIAQEAKIPDPGFYTLGSPQRIYQSVQSISDKSPKGADAASNICYEGLASLQEELAKRDDLSSEEITQHFDTAKAAITNRLRGTEHATPETIAAATDYLDRQKERTLKLKKLSEDDKHGEDFKRLYAYCRTTPDLQQAFDEIDTDKLSFEELEDMVSNEVFPKGTNAGKGTGCDIEFTRKDGEKFPSSVTIKPGKTYNMRKTLAQTMKMIRAYHAMGLTPVVKINGGTEKQVEELMAAVRGECQMASIPIKLSGQTAPTRTGKPGKKYAVEDIMPKADKYVARHGRNRELASLQDEAQNLVDTKQAITGQEQEIQRLTQAIAAAGPDVDVEPLQTQLKQAFVGLAQAHQTYSEVFAHHLDGLNNFASKATDPAQHLAEQKEVDALRTRLQNTHADVLHEKPLASLFEAANTKVADAQKELVASQQAFKEALAAAGKDPMTDAQIETLLKSRDFEHDGGDLEETYNKLTEAHDNHKQARGELDALKTVGEREDVKKGFGQIETDRAEFVKQHLPNPESERKESPNPFGNFGP